MNDLIVNNIILIVKQDMICQVISNAAFDPSPPPSHSPLPPKTEKKEDAAATRPSDDIAHATVDTPASAADPPTNMIYFF